MYQNPAADQVVETVLTDGTQTQQDGAAGGGTLLARLGSACSASIKCETGLMCCSGVCAQSVKAPSSTTAQCPDDCRGGVGWPVGTCGKTWNTDITSTCDKCKWDDREKAPCKSCLKDIVPKTTNKTCAVPKRGCDSGWTFDNVLTCSKTEKSKTICKPGRGKLIQVCNTAGETLKNGGCYAGSLYKRLPALKEECSDYADVKSTRTAHVVAGCKVAESCPVGYTLKDNTCKHNSEGTCSTAGYSVGWRIDANANKCVRKGACADGWTKHPKSNEHCIK
jgi:hypothetical protein